MKKHNFVHCGDLHLGCTPNHLEERYEDFFISFKDLIDNAINNKCEYMLISGDLFHLKVINSKTLLKVVDLLEYAKDNNIKIFVIEGNHDKAFYVDADSWLVFLHEKKYITLLSHKIVNNELVLDENSIYEDENIRIIGIGYLGATTSLYLKDIENKISKSNKFTVLMLHAAINRLYGEEMGDVSIDLLRPLKEKIDYVALGHIHTNYEYDDFCYNPGSIENIRIKDATKSDKKGYYIVSFDDKKQKDVNFYISKQRKIYNISLKLEDDKSIIDIEKYIKEYDYNLEESSVLELSLYGITSFNPYVINFDDIKQTIMNKYKLLYIDINNYINIMSSNTNMNDVIDIKSIEKEAIGSFLSVNFPTIENNKELVDTIINLKNAIIEEQEYDQIVKNMLEKGEE